MNYDSPKAIAERLAAAGLALKKRFGQNFLIARAARERIVGIIAPKEEDRLWEIGPGIGSMTHMLIGRVKSLTLFEIDRGFVRLLNETFGNEAGVRIVAGDFLKTWFDERKAYGLPDTIFGNLPFSSASAIIASLIQEGAGEVRVVATVQREVARRMAGTPSTKDWSGFSVLCQSAYEVVEHGDLRSGSFYPAPAVVSTIIELRPHGRFRATNPSFLFELTRILFAARRKTIRNNLAAAGKLQSWATALTECGIDPDQRGEQLSVEKLVRLSNVIATEFSERP